MILQSFRGTPKQKECSVCGTKVDAYNSISIRMIDQTAHYKLSGYPIVDCFAIKCCKKCYDRISDKFHKIKLDG